MRPCLKKQKEQQQQKTIIKIIFYPVALDYGSPHSLMQQQKMEPASCIFSFKIQTPRKPTKVGAVPAPSTLHSAQPGSHQELLGTFGKGSIQAQDPNLTIKPGVEL